MSTEIRILIVEDFEEDAMLILRELRRGGFEPTYKIVERPEELRQALALQDWDLIVSDHSLPHFSGTMALEVLKQTGLDIPFIIVSGKIGEDAAVEAMKSGVHDYIMKGNLTRLAPAVQRELREARVRLEHRQIEKQLKTTERLRAVGSLAATIIHDLKQPMQVILSCADLLDEGEIEGSERSNCAREVTKQVRRMLSMSQEILDYVSSKRRLQLAPVDLDQLCRDVVEIFRPRLLADRVNVRYSKWSAETASPTLELDHDRFWRVLVNLIGNAHEAMPEGGELRIRLTIDRKSVGIEIEDTGKGIPPQIQETIYEPFVTEGKQYGTGLGLAIAKSIVEAHKGTISFTSSPAEGTAFRIILPRSSDGSTTMAAVDGASRASA